MAWYAVEPTALEAADAAVAARGSVCRAELSALRASVDELLSSDWRGSAAVAFGLGWNEWLAGVVAMLDALDWMAAALGSAGVGYAWTDVAVRSSVERASA